MTPGQPAGVSWSREFPAGRTRHPRPEAALTRAPGRRRAACYLLTEIRRLPAEPRLAGLGGPAARPAGAGRRGDPMADILPTTPELDDLRAAVRKVAGKYGHRYFVDCATSHAEPTELYG